MVFRFDAFTSKYLAYCYFNTSGKRCPCEVDGGDKPKILAMVGATSTG